MQATIRAHWPHVMALHEDVRQFNAFLYNSILIISIQDRLKALENGRAIPQLPKVIADLLRPHPPHRAQTPVFAINAHAAIRHENANDAARAAAPSGKPSNTENEVRGSCAVIILS